MRHDLIVTAGAPLTVTAALTTPMLDAELHPMPLDGPLAWAAVQFEQTAGRPIGPISAAWAPDLPIGLARWTQDAEVWGWCTSRATYEVTRQTAAQVRRRPATHAMVRYTPDRSHHLGLGPHKARDIVVSATIIPAITWHVLADDRQLLEDLLAAVTHIGRGRATDHGHVRKWTVESSVDRDGWRDRPLPDPDGTLQGVRAPYWHPTRRALCTDGQQC